METSKRLWPRMWSFLIDFVIVFFVASLICNIKILNPTYDEYNKSTTSYQENYEDYLNGDITINEFYSNTEDLTIDLYKYGTSNYIIYLIVIIGYFVFFQKYNNGQTVGKRINKIKVVNSNNENPSIKIYLLRVMFIFIIGIGGIFSILSCIILPHVLGSSNFETWITAITITNMLLALIDCEVLIINKNRLSLHDKVCNTHVVELKTLD